MAATLSRLRWLGLALYLLLFAGLPALLYVSDHGELLGEKGLYLHGLPYAIAPEEQTRIPMT